MNSTPIYSININPTDPYYGAIPSVVANVAIPTTLGRSVNQGTYVPAGLSSSTIPSSVWANQGFSVQNSVLSPDTLKVQGNAEFEGNLTLKGRNLTDWLEAVEARLVILQPNPELEAGWQELADIRIKYIELERELIEKQQMFNILKNK